MDNFIYDFIFKDILVPNADSLINSYPSTKYNTEVLRNKIYTDYQKFRDGYKKHFELDSEQGKKRIDRHKICSCITISILNNSPITVKDKSSHLLNEYFAIKVSLQILKRFHFTAEYRKNKDKANQLREQECSYPEKIKSENDYPIELAKLLAYCREDFQKEEGSFKVHLSFLSHLFFQIEAYALSKLSTD